ncbi:hypothetical protein ABBQ32_007929 [Trebouxia sp. C0010 RCD-2024]
MGADAGNSPQLSFRSFKAGLSSRPGGRGGAKSAVAGLSGSGPTTPGRPLPKTAYSMPDPTTTPTLGPASGPGIPRSLAQGIPHPPSPGMPHSLDQGMPHSWSPHVASSGPRPAVRSAPALEGSAGQAEDVNSAEGKDKKAPSPHLASAQHRHQHPKRLRLQQQARWSSLSGKPCLLTFSASQPPRRMLIHMIWGFLGGTNQSRGGSTTQLPSQHFPAPDMSTATSCAHVQQEDAEVALVGVFGGGAFLAGVADRVAVCWGEGRASLHSPLHPLLLALFLASVPPPPSSPPLGRLKRLSKPGSTNPQGLLQSCSQQAWPQRPLLPPPFLPPTAASSQGLFQSPQEECLEEGVGSDDRARPRPRECTSILDLIL